MQPPAEVEPARVRTEVALLSCSMVLKISEARPRSREVKDILFMALTIGRASNDLMSMCSTGVESRSALRLDLGCGLVLTALRFFMIRVSFFKFWGFIH